MFGIYLQYLKKLFCSNLHCGYNYCKIFTSVSVLLLFISYESIASHAVGLDIQYECIGGNQYRLTLNFYRDCAGVSAPNAATIRISSASCGVNSTVSLPLDTFFEISPLCPNQQNTSTCRGGNNPGIQQYIYSGNYTFPLQCNDWVIGYTLCCRNNAITNLQNPGNYNIHAQATMSNMNNMCNNSPIFTTRPVPFVCAGQVFNYNHGAVDLDGDSLAYVLVNPLDNTIVNIPYRNPFTANNPLTTTGGFNFNNNTGQMSFNPSANQQAVVTVIVYEYRNGVLIGTTMRDMQLVVISSCNNINPTATGINGTNNFSIDVCAGYPLCFNIFTNDQNTGQTTTLTLNNGIQGATFNTSGSPFQQAQFCWTSTPADIGANDFSITVVDDACPYFGSNNYTYTVNVIPNPNPPVDAGPDADICANECVQLNATGPPSVVRYRWTPTTGLNNPNIRNPTACPQVTTTYTVFAVYADSCAATDEITVRVQPSPNPDIFPKTAVVCAGSSIQLTATANMPSTFQWNSGATGNIAVVTPTANTNYVVTATNTYGCTATDTAFITYSPPPPPQICNNIYVTPNGTGSGLLQNDPTDIVTAVSLAQCNNLTIKMSIGNYTLDNPIQLSSLLTIEGGFNPANAWRKTSQAGATTIRRTTANVEGQPDAPRIVAFYANGATFWRLQDLTITVDNAPTAQPAEKGISTYGLHLTACNNFDLVRTQIIAGNGGAGGIGLAGANGSPGPNGQNGNGQTGGAGGCNNGICGGNGGNGGNSCVLFCSGDNGQNGAAGQNGGGAGGAAANGAAFCGAQPASGGNGANGTNGIAGANGAAGSFVNGFFEPGAQAGAGTNGTDGLPGGGGGGRGGAQAGAAGGGGGGGGAGGGGGQGGQGGAGGGGSFGVVFYNNGANGNFTNTNVQAGIAGTGGTGGSGGIGSNGGTGGSGGQTSAIFGGCSNDNGNGGNGGAGGNGGTGGTGSNGITQTLRVEGGSNPVAQDITFNLVAQPVITVENISCTQTPVGYASANAANWDFGAGATPQTANAAAGSPIYTSVGRKNITYSGNVYNGFHRIAIDNNSYVPEIQTTANPINANTFWICAGNPVDFFTTTPGVGFNWNMGGGVNPNTYTTANVPGLVFNTAGTYIITLSVITDCCGPTLPDSITLIVDASPIIVLAGDSSICFGESTDITVSGAATYFWNPGVGTINTPTATISLSPTVTTTYTITGNSLLGYCNASTNLTIVVNPLPSLNTSTSPATCSNDGSATVNAAGGSGNYLYRWNDANNQTTPTANNLFTGNYSVTVIDNTTGCENSTTAFVSNDGAPVAYIQNITDVLCYNGNDGSTTAAVASGMPPFIFSWNNGASGETLNSLNAGIYIVTVTDSRGCFSQATAIISQPDSLLLDVTNTDSVSCFGFSDGRATVTADGGSGNYNFSWNTNPAQYAATATNLTAGTYTVTLTDANNCSKIIDIAIFEPLPLSMQITSSDAICYNSNDGAATAIVTDPTPVSTYQWSNGSTANPATGLAAGNYSITLININGCTISDTVTVNAPPPIWVDASPDSSEIKFGESVELTTSYSDNVQGTPVYVWEPTEGLSCTNCFNPTATPDYTTVYQLTLIDNAGCTATDRVLVEVNLEKTLFVPNAFTPNANGRNDIFYVYAKGAKDIHLKVFNRWGEKIFESFDLNTGWDGTYKGKLLNPGVYVYYVEVVYLDGNKKTAKGSVTLIL
jgi:gliding motility-associated-like protein